MSFDPWAWQAPEGYQQQMTRTSEAMLNQRICRESAPQRGFDSSECCGSIASEDWEARQAEYQKRRDEVIHQYGSQGPNFHSPAAGGWDSDWF